MRPVLDVMTKSARKNNLNIPHLPYDRHAALQIACLARQTARFAPCLASRLKAVNCPIYFFSTPKWAQMGRATGYFLVGVLALTCLVAATSVRQAMAPGMDAARHPPSGQWVDVGGHRLHIVCVGAGRPTVVLEAGMSGWSVDWSLVQPALARHTRTCAYDRAGYGWSDEAQASRSSAQVADELHALLVGAHIDEPIVLVGHSLGGLFAQMFARRYPRSVAGLVLVDSVHRAQSAEMPADLGRPYEVGMRRLTAASALVAPTGLLRFLDQPASVVAARLPEPVRAAAVDFSFESKSYRTLAAEMRAFDESQQQVAAAGPLPAVPSVVLVSAEARDFPPGFSAGPMKSRWDELQRQQLGLRPENAVITVAGSGHYIHLDRPDAVAQAVLSVLRQARQDAMPAP